MNETQPRIPVRRAAAGDAGIVASLAHMLWPHCPQEKLREEYEDLLASEDCAVFLAGDGAQTVAFAQAGLRHDYVEGSGSSPVGYLEAVYVEESVRRQGIANELVRRCEQWAGAKGCSEFASDCELTNDESRRFHLRAGFTEANRIICFIKRL